MNFVKRIFWLGKHPHIRAEFFREGLNDVNGLSSAGHPHALGCILLVIDTALMIESYDSMELEFLKT